LSVVSCQLSVTPPLYTHFFFDLALFVVEKIRYFIDSFIFEAKSVILGIFIM